MNIIIFIIILGLLVFIHELGHFLFAKLFKIRVDEFGFGYPPRMFKIFRWKNTDFTMNWIPFGGFVRIFGESDDGKELEESEKKVSLVYKPRWQQIVVMFGGILFNIIFAWIIFTGIFISGIISPISSAPESYTFEKTELMITTVLDNSPAEEAGLKSGDVIKGIYSKNTDILITNEGAEEVSNFIKTKGSDSDIGFVISRGIEEINILTNPEIGIVGDKYSIGIGLDRVGELKLPFFSAIYYGAKNTIGMTRDIFIGFGQLISGKISIDAVSGPVGIAKQVGSAANIGFTYLIGFAAMLSLNLAVLNFIPFPALDGGRIFILIIESIIRKRLNPKIVNWINVIGFFLLIGLMIFVTIKDIINLF